MLLLAWTNVSGRIHSLDQDFTESGMQLRRLHIQNYRAIRDQEFSFADAMGRIRPVTVLAGPNGCGKTSVLFAIYRALSGAMGYYSDDVPDASDDEIFREGGAGNWSFQPNHVAINLELAYTVEEREAAPQLLEATRIIQRPRTDGQPTSIPPLPNGLLDITWEYPPLQYADGTFKPLAFVRSSIQRGPSWLGLPKLAIRGWRNRPRRLVELDLLDKIGILRMFAQNRGKRWIAAEEREAFPPEGPEGEEEFDAAEAGPPRRRPNVTVSGILKVLADAARGRRPNGAPPEENIEQKVRDLFGRICAPKRYVGYVYYGPNDVLGTPLVEEGDRQYPLSMAATGEQVVLDYLTQFVYPRPVNNSLILIDEPELHLHPRWIRQLYRALPQMGRGNQFIMTTHSPELRQLAAEENALIDLGHLGEPSGSPVRA
jgi:ABC-type branched-subunit amino acid transport system ATPase component